MFQRLVWTLHALLSYYRHHGLQTLFLITGLVTGVGLWAAVQVINSHARASYEDANRLLGAQASHWIRAIDDSGIAPETYVQLRRDGFRQVYPVIDKRLITSSQQQVNLIATDLLALPLDADGAFNSTSNWSQLMLPPFQAWYPQTLADSIDLESGEQLELLSGARLPPAVIQAQPQQGQRIFMDIGAAMTVLDEHHFSYLAVGELAQKEKSALLQALPDRLRLVANEQSLDLAELTESLHIQLSAMSLLSFAVGLFIVFNAVRFALNARATTIATLQELGVGLPLLATAIVIETLLLSIIGAAAGLTMGYFIGQQLLPSVAISLQNLYGAVLDHHLLLEPLIILKAWGMTLAGLVIALAWPLWQRTRTVCISQRGPAGDWTNDGKARRMLLYAAMGLLIVAVSLYPRMTTVIEGFALLALLLFAAAWLLPTLLAITLDAARSLTPKHAWLMQWALDDGRSQLPVLRTALMALLLALTANLGVDTLVGSFRTALQSWLDQRIAADIYINSDSIKIDSVLQSPLLVTHHQRNGVNLRWQDRPTLVYGLDTDAPDTRQLPLAKQATDLDDWYQGDRRMILANEQVHHLAGIDLGDTITLPAESGETDFRVAGFFHDYGNSYYQLYLPYETVEELWPSAGSRGLALWLSTTGMGDIDDIRNTIEQTLVDAGAEPGEWVYRDDILDLSLDIFDRTFAITASMNMLTLTVAGIALLASLLAIHQQRLPQYAHWRSMGVRWTEWLMVILIPLGLCVLITWALSIPLGTLLAWILIHDLNVLAFGWTMPLVWSFSPGLQLALLTAAVVAITFTITLLRVRYHMPDALKQLGVDR